MGTCDHVMVGFGFGPIQTGLFAKEAREGGCFTDIAVAEVDASLVAAVRSNNDCYAINVAYEDRIEPVQIEGVTLLNPADRDDCQRLCKTLERATDIVTALPSVEFFARGGTSSVAHRIAEGLRGKEALQTVVYTAENNNHAAELLGDVLTSHTTDDSRAMRRFQCLNTVIGKMSQVIVDPQEIKRRGLMPIAPGVPKAVLVETFNHILVSQIELPGFERGFAAFEEKKDLYPFEEAKLYGHNAAHTMLGFLGAAVGESVLSELSQYPEIMQEVRHAFLDESGAALVSRYGRLGDDLFTASGFESYVDDLLRRMTNPYLSDTIDRAVRDPARKLGWSDRLFGAIRFCIANGVASPSLAVGAMAGLQMMSGEGSFKRLMTGEEIDGCLATLWDSSSCDEAVRGRIRNDLEQAQVQFRRLLSAVRHL